MYFFFFFFFFFHWHYNPLWVLAFSVILFHSALSLHCFLHPFIPIICISSLISTIHLFLRLPLILVPIGLHSKIFLGVLHCKHTTKKNSKHPQDTLTVFSGLMSTYCSCSQGSLFAPCHRRCSPHTPRDPVCKPQYQAVPLPQGEQSGLFPEDLESPHYKSQCVTHVPGTCTHKISFVFVRLPFSQQCSWRFKPSGILHCATS